MWEDLKGLIGAFVTFLVVLFIIGLITGMTFWGSTVNGVTWMLHDTNMLSGTIATLGLDSDASPYLAKCALGGIYLGLVLVLAIIMWKIAAALSDYYGPRGRVAWYEAPINGFGRFGKFVTFFAVLGLLALPLYVYHGLHGGSMPF